MTTNSSVSIIDTGRKKFRSLFMSTGSERKTNSGMDAAVSPWLATRLVTTGMSAFVSLPRRAMWVCSSLCNQRHWFRVGKMGLELSFCWIFYFSFCCPVDDCCARWWWLVRVSVEGAGQSHWLSGWCHSAPGTKKFHPSIIADLTSITSGVCFGL